MWPARDSHHQNGHEPKWLLKFSRIHADYFQTDNNGDGKRAIIAIEKGTPGERAFTEAFAIW
jgi:hypothetical protein